MFKFSPGKDWILHPKLKETRFQQARDEIQERVGEDRDAFNEELGKLYDSYRAEINELFPTTEERFEGDAAL